MTDKTVCGKSGCTEYSVIKQGRQNLCPKHYRFGQMRVLAKRRGLAVPSYELLDKLLNEEMKCPDCGVTMNWRSKDGMASVASLQHYRDGTFGIVCRSCNTRHAYTPDDSYRDMPKDHKYCPKCKKYKPRGDFYTDNGRTGNLKTKSHCKKCSDESVYSWREKNKESINKYQRDYRLRRKQSGNPIKRK
ncbi:hypothetical protein [Providencia rustigianii]|uniref:hypothetical protein n=1 Tax=Providencia rustigianii TaxID=158850 RepID=UPI0022446B40|nr:hypothetical protein [Providencia rustigianii]